MDFSCLLKEISNHVKVQNCKYLEILELTFGVTDGI